jgi:hypothetical protein
MKKLEKKIKIRFWLFLHLPKELLIEKNIKELQLKRTCDIIARLT